MIKLKVGKNYLITNNDRPANISGILYPITFMSSFLEGENKTCIDLVTAETMNDIVMLSKYAIQLNMLDVTVLTHLDMNVIRSRHMNGQLENFQYVVRDFIKRLREGNPLINVKVIMINKYQKNPLFTTTYNMLASLAQDKRFLLYYLQDLPIYKDFVTRNQEIPKEMEVIDNEIKKLTNKREEVCGESIDMRRINKLKLIKDVKVNEMDELQLNIHPLYITPAHQLGKCWSQEAIADVKYLYETIKHYYLGYKFRMCETVITINRTFNVKVIKVVDPRYELLLSGTGWAGPGYCHIGYNSHCYGEFNDVIARAKELGLEYYFIGLKQYLTTANVLDSAGDNIWAWPLVDENDNIVYSALLDRARDYLLSNSNPGDLSPTDKEMLRAMTFNELFDYIQKRGWKASNLRGNYNGPDTMSYSSRSTDGFLAICKKREPEIYDKIMERGEIKDAN
jgi:hypothetical protein